MANLKEEKVFKDPIHQYIYVHDKIIWDLINTKEFQRLRRIKQLGTSFFTFHGAEHSRFSHSLGVYEITRKIISLFKRTESIDLTEEERIAVLAAALLHDIGHGPFSHSVEKVFHFDHENWSKKIILEDTDIHKLIVKLDNNLPDFIVKILNKTCDNPSLSDIISGQLDADRMDYLLRDAYFTGVNYGAFDLERILRVLRPFDNRLVVKESGMHSVEDYLMSRYQMYWQVYFHPVSRSGEILLKKIFLRAEDLYKKNYTFSTLFPQIRNLFEKTLKTSDYFYLDDAFIYTLFQNWSKEKDVILSDLADRFINRRLFQYVDFNPNDLDKKEKMESLLKSKGIDTAYYLEIDSPSDLSYDIYRPGKGGKKAPIYLLNKQDDLIEISEKSEIIAAIMGKRKTLHKLYFPYDLLKDRKIISEFEYIIKSEHS